MKPLQKEEFATDAYYSKLICCPKCKREISFFGNDEKPESSGLCWCRHCSSVFPCSEGFIQFIGDAQVYRASRREDIMRSIYARMYTPLTNLMFLPCGGVARAREEVLENLEVRPGASVLETGIGVGDNIPYLNSRLKGCIYYGLDNQMIMLRKCAGNAVRWNQPIKLYRANAEELPFRDNSFDVVFHLGAINLFQDKQSAINEMIRVAKPGTRIVIADESEKASRLFAIFVGKHDPVVPPVGLVPLEMQELSLKSIWNDYGYLITFRKPF